MHPAMEARLAMNAAPQKPIVVIGYGNSLRGDDAVGRRVVERISERRLPYVVSICATQLVPELAAQVADARAVIFVDACLSEHAKNVVVREIDDASCFHGASHEGSPRELLALGAMCYGRMPSAWIVAVPVASFELTDGLSTAASEQVALAVEAVDRLVAQLRGSEVAYA
jgi:hydrogenase maturation protease